MRNATRHPRVWDPTIEPVVEALEADTAWAALIVGAPGMGKTAVLAAAADLVARRTQRTILWVSGGVVAGDAHLASILASTAGVPFAPGDSLDSVCVHLATLKGRMVLLTVDDFDDLVFKRESIAIALARTVASGTAVRLLASCRPDARDRLTDPGRPFAATLDSRIAETVLTVFDRRAARSLIRRRAPRLSPEAAAAVIQEAGGHPAALVFLSRLAELRDEQSEVNLEEFFRRAAEFAGAVYAEPWTELGPQQRAILGHLAQAGQPSSAAEIARALLLPAGHVSAQLSRLGAAGLITRSRQRGLHTVAPLLARWITQRAVREERQPRSSTSGGGVDSPIAGIAGEVLLCVGGQVGATAGSGEGH